MYTKGAEFDFCVIGGGLSGLCAAVAAARHGVKTLLIQDRPVLGGNASSEIRMWVCGSQFCVESGLIEEFFLENCHRNPEQVYAIWDSILYEKAKYQENLTTFLNTSCCDCEVKDGKIVSVKAWQLTTYTMWTIRAKLFADCSGDSILAESSGAEFYHGHEARATYNESIAPDEADHKTMGSSCMLQAREYEEPKPFKPPFWARKFDGEIPGEQRAHNFDGNQNFWWLELGGTRNTLRDAEDIRDRILPLLFGVWDHVKNGGEHGAANWAIDWVGFLPGKRESRRYIGDYVVTQHDVDDGGHFDDIVAFGGWPMDNHDPAGFESTGEVTTFNPVKDNFGIPYRALYSKNVDNLFFAGRNISVSHVALSSTRVMATCALIGQAVGTAASIAIARGVSPREVGCKYIADVQRILQDDDCYLPRKSRLIDDACLKARLTTDCGSDVDVLRNGEDRRGKLLATSGNNITYTLDKACKISEIRIVFDSGLEQRFGKIYRRNLPANRPLKPFWDTVVPDSLPQSWHLDYRDENGDWRLLATESDQYLRLFALRPNSLMATGLRLVIDSTRSEKCGICSFDFTIEK